MSGDVGRAKRELRRRLGARRRAVPPEWAREAAAACGEALLREARIRAARRVALYAALPDELPTRALFEVLADPGRVRLLPRMEAEGGVAFAAVDAWDALVPGPRGVLEPPADAPGVPLGPGDVLLVPGVAFDRAGWRLGRGGGAYDRALARAPGAWAVGLAYAFQIVDAVPHDSHDRRVDAIVTEEGWCAVERDEEG